MGLEGVILFMAPHLLCHTTKSYLPEFGNNFHVQLGILYTFLLIVIKKAYYFIFTAHICTLLMLLLRFCTRVVSLSAEKQWTPGMENESSLKGRPVKGAMD